MCQHPPTHQVNVSTERGFVCARFQQIFWDTMYMCKICARLYFFLQCAIYVQDFSTIYAQNIIIQQVIKFSIFLFKLTGQTTYNKEKKITSNVIFFLIINNLIEMLR